MTIKQLEEKVSELTKQVDELNRQINEIHRQAAEITEPFKSGDIVEDQKGIIYRVLSVFPWPHSYYPNILPQFRIVKMVNGKRSENSIIRSYNGILFKKSKIKENQ